MIQTHLLKRSVKDLVLKYHESFVNAHSGIIMQYILLARDILLFKSFVLRVTFHYMLLCCIMLIQNKDWINQTDMRHKWEDVLVG